MLVKERHILIDYLDTYIIAVGTRALSFYSDSFCPNRNKVVHYGKDLGIIGGCSPLALTLE